MSSAFSNAALLDGSRPAVSPPQPAAKARRRPEQTQDGLEEPARVVGLLRGELAGEGAIEKITQNSATRSALGRRCGALMASRLEQLEASPRQR